jgi:hypothetical protein
MYILCDTCSVLMLIRIAPDMFRDDSYGCVTIQEVFQELFRTQKFKTKYPWRTKYKSKIKALIKSKVETGDFNLYLEAIRNIIVTGKINKRTKRFFSLSYIDQQIAACSIAHGFKLTTVDDDLADFIRQEFSGKTISPLGIVDDWIKKGLIKWDDDLQSILEDWDKCNEHPQPKKEVKRFEKITGFKYTGP